MGLWVVCSNLAPGKSSPPPLFYELYRAANQPVRVVTGQHVPSSRLSRDSMFRVRDCHGTACSEYRAVTGQHVPSTRLSRDSMSGVRGCHGTACPEHAAVTRRYVPTTQLSQKKQNLKVHKNENFFGFDFEFCTVSLLVMLKYEGFVKNFLIRP